MTDRWFYYKRGGWAMAVNAVNRNDANAHIKRSAPGAVFQGEGIYPAHESVITGMVTDARHKQIREKMEETSHD
jgi:hypothetical protein